VRDEEILAQREEARGAASNDIFLGPVTAGGEIRLFVRREILDGHAALMLPEDFKILPGALAAAKYPMGRRPQEIQAEPNARVCFAFRLEKETLAPENVEKAATEARRLIIQANPAARAGEVESGAAPVGPVAWFDCQTSGMDGPLYLIIAVASLGVETLFVFFDCPERDGKSWGPIARQAILSLVMTRRD
jgi:hypothetical protein